MAIESGILKPSGVIQLRGGTHADMTAENPLLSRREIAVEIDTGKIKVGNGTDKWNALPYADSGKSGIVYAEGELELPNDEDGTVYVVQDGMWVAATLVEQPSEWSPKIDDTEEIVLVLDDDMTPYQLYGDNTEVNL